MWLARDMLWWVYVWRQITALESDSLNCEWAGATSGTTATITDRLLTEHVGIMLHLLPIAQQQLSDACPDGPVLRLNRLFLYNPLALSSMAPGALGALESAEEEGQGSQDDLAMLKARLVEELQDLDEAARSEDEDWRPLTPLVHRICDSEERTPTSIHLIKMVGSIDSRKGMIGAGAMIED